MTRLLAENPEYEARALEEVRQVLTLGASVPSTDCLSHPLQRLGIACSLNRKKSTATNFVQTSFSHFFTPSSFAEEVSLPLKKDSLVASLLPVAMPGAPSSVRSLLVATRSRNGRAEPSVDDVPKLQFVEQCFREALRLYSPVTSLTRDVAYDTLLGGHRAFQGERTFNESFEPFSFELPVTMFANRGSWHRY